MVRESYILNKGYLFAAFTAIIWSLQAIVIKVALTSLNPVSVVWFRFAVAFTGMLLFLLLFDRSFISVFRRPPVILFMAAVFLGMNYLGFISGLHETTPSNAQVFIQVGPVGLALAGIFFFREKITWKHLAGFALLIMGFFLFYSEQLVEIGGERGNYSNGVLYVVLGGLSWASFSILQKILVRTRNPHHLNLFIFGLCSMIFLPFFQFSSLPLLSVNEILILTSLGLMTLVAYVSFALALKYAEANKVSVIITMNPILTFVSMALLEVAAVSWIEFEKFTLLSLAGSALVCGGAVLVIISRGKLNVR